MDCQSPIVNTIYQEDKRGTNTGLYLPCGLRLAFILKRSLTSLLAWLLTCFISI